ncbi:MAG TPA: hypothetical protein PKD59_10990 [Miltoncostaeaceae bacterium]|nr:hypothetical protein [Miltoncostaeaceae bacterium]
MEDPHMRRRAVATMVLYVSVVLMGALATIPADDLDDDPKVAAVIWGSALGLALAHWFAFNASAHLFRGEGITADELREGVWEAFAALGVAVVATVPLLVLGDTAAAAVSLIALAAVVTVVAYVASRHGGLSRGRALLRGGVTLVLAVIVAALKIRLGY